MLFIIDGTGDSDDDNYNKDMKTGFCRMMEFEFGGRYYRGPNMSGNQVPAIAQKVLNDIVNDYLNTGRFKDEPLFLAGHSRGGATAVKVAHLLQERSITSKSSDVKIQSIFLFDAVNRSIASDTDRIPSNVNKCYHAMRKREFADFYKPKLEQAIADEERCIASQTGIAFPFTETRFGGSSSVSCADLTNKRVRLEKMDRLLRFAMRTETIVLMNNLKYISMTPFDFGNVIDKDNKVQSDQYNTPLIVIEHFPATHGAIGGSPITYEKIKGYDDEIDRNIQPDSDDNFLIASDLNEMRKVKNWMWENIRSEGLQANVSLNPRYWLAAQEPNTENNAAGR